MMGHIGFSPSFGQTLGYCLQDKRISQEQTQRPADIEHRQTRNRAEVLYYHHCYGDIQQLTRQFKEIQKQNFNIIKPAFHLSLSLPPEDKIAKSRFVDIAQDCAKALDFEKHQYVVILHKDTEHPHVHLVVNRIGADKHLMAETNMFKRIDQFCREAELKYQLTPVQSMRRYQSPEERLKPSQGLRVAQLKKEITQALKQTQDLASFKAQMQERGYKVHKTERGISFTDRDKVFTPGSKADFPWKKIESALAQNLAERQAQELRLEQERIRQLELKPKLELKRKPDFEPDDHRKQVQRRGHRMRM
ncbi:MAG TPA: relaxase/mobilization nuclease domain-containing protein [Puia sp.]|nr:relaxase/mobilization nuclease domain-containing protein [Puia sp.]